MKGHFFVVVPVYEDKIAAARLVKELKSCYGESVTVVAVDDGSTRMPTSVAMLNDNALGGCVIFLKRNVGHQRALAIGLNYVSTNAQPDDLIVLMDSDGEDRPDSIKKLLDDIEFTKVDVVVATRKSRVETLKFKIFYFCYKQIFFLLSGKKISFGNYMCMTKAAAMRLSAMQETSLHIAASVLASKLKIDFKPIDRGARYAGISRMNFVSLVLHGFKALMVFAEDVLVRVGIASILVAVCAIFCSLAAVLLKSLGFSTPGWFSIALGILVLMLIQTGTLSLMMLMLSGIIRSGTVTTDIDYSAFIDRIEYSDYEQNDV